MQTTIIGKKRKKRIIKIKRVSLVCKLFIKIILVCLQPGSFSTYDLHLCFSTSRNSCKLIYVKMRMATNCPWAFFSYLYLGISSLHWELKKNSLLWCKKIDVNNEIVDVKKVNGSYLFVKKYVSRVCFYI